MSFIIYWSHIDVTSRCIFGIFQKKGNRTVQKKEAGFQKDIFVIERGIVKNWEMQLGKYYNFNERALKLKMKDDWKQMIAKRWLKAETENERSQSF